MELRGFDGASIRSGYYDDHYEVARKAAFLGKWGLQLYMTFNEIDPGLLARVDNRLVERPKSTTTDADIVRRQFLLVDIDPIRPSGLSATDEEKRAAYSRAVEIRDHLREKGWRDPVIADSGNGFHFLYPVDLPNDEESRQLVRCILVDLARRFDDQWVRIDTGVSNAARLTRLYGTINRKGKNTPERPHRRSRILKVPGEAE